MNLQGLVFNTDYDWYGFLKERPHLAEVNFWLPSGGYLPRAQVGTPIFFKLKRPYYAIAGYGFLVHASKLPAWLAWERYGEANGAATFEDMRRRIEKYRRLPEPDLQGTYEIGCLMLSQQTFFEQDQWIDPPADWKREIVRGKGYDLMHGEGARVWASCLAQGSIGGVARDVLAASSERYGEPILVAPRLGQESFRIAVLDAYGRACAVCQEHSLPALEAAHIRPYADGGEHTIPNGLLLRSDIHRLFDKGYVTVTPDWRFHVSKRLKMDFANGRSYAAFNGQQIHVPRKTGLVPDPKVLLWHNDVKFLG